jgi:ribA/ribD-fused uncharacterized protein
MSKQYTFFYKTRSPFSNWHPAFFTDEDGIEYNCTEQYMMYKKAKMFGDHETAIEILDAMDPREQKALGRKVKGFVSSIWEANAKSVVYDGCKLKFEQNPHLLQKLLDKYGVVELWSVEVSGLGSGLTNTGTAQEPVLAIASTGTITFEDVNATSIATTDLSSVNFPTVDGISLPTQPRQLVPKAYVDNQSYGVQSVSAGDSSIQIGGTPANPTVSVAVSGITGGTYTNSTITVGADGRLTSASSGTQPFTELNAGSGISISETPGSATISNDGVLELTAGTNITITGSKSNYTINASGGGGGVSSVSGTLGQIDVANGTSDAVVSLSAFGTGEATYSFPSSIAVDDYGRVISAVSGTQTTVNSLEGAVVLSAGTNITLDTVGKPPPK